MKAKVSDFIQDDRNLNKGTARGKVLMDKSLSQFGAGRSILVDKNGRIIAGNKTQLAALQAGIVDAEVVETTGDKLVVVKRTDVDLDSKAGRELALADNATQQVNLEWDEDAMKDVAETFDVNFEDWGVTFDEDETDEGLSGSDTKDPKAESLISEAVRAAAGEIADQYDKLKGFSFITPHTAKIDFINFCYYGKEYPRYNSLAFHRNQFLTNGDLKSTYDGLRAVEKGEIKVERLRFVTGDKLSSITKGSLAFSGARMPLDFPAYLSRDLINEFCPEYGAVLDPCSGWGGRIIGFLASHAQSYTGVDASPYQVENDMRIFETFKDATKFKKEASIICSPFEKYDAGENKFDFALTSPPYFDTEEYIGGEQSHSSSDNYEQWRENFYTPLITKVYAALKKGCVFALQVGSQRYPLLEDGKRIAIETGFACIGVRATEMTNSFNKTEEMSGECVLLLQK